MTNPRADLEPTYLKEQFRSDEAYRRQCKADAANWGWADRSDPFAAQRALTHLSVGIADYNAGDYSFRRTSQHRTSDHPFSDGSRDYVVDVPQDMKRP